MNRAKNQRRSGLRALAVGVLVPLGFGLLMLLDPERGGVATAISNVAVSADGRIVPYVPSDAPVPAGGSIGALSFGVEQTYYGVPRAFCVRLVPTARYMARSGSMAPLSQEHIDRFVVPQFAELMMSGSTSGVPRELDARAAMLLTDMSPRVVVWWPGVWRHVIVSVIVGVVLFAVSYLCDRIWWANRLRDARARAFCPVCEYALDGLKVSACPECGSEVEV